MYEEELNVEKEKSKDKNKKEKPEFRFDFDIRGILKKLGILVIVLFLFIFVTTKVGKKSEKKVIQNNLEMMRTGAYEYFKENPRPTENNEEFIVTLQELIDANKIEPLKDKKDNLCDSIQSKVSILKQTSTKYDLNVILQCGEVIEESKYDVTYTNTTISNASSNETELVYYKLQKGLSVDNYSYSCPSQYTLAGKYCYSNVSKLSATPVAKYNTTSAKRTKASYKKGDDEYIYVDPIEIWKEDSYVCTNKDATLVGDKCIIEKDATTKEQAEYVCPKGTLSGTKCIIKEKATLQEKYTCSSGELLGSQCRITKRAINSFVCPKDYPKKSNNRCYYVDDATKVWSDWVYQKEISGTFKRTSTNTKLYKLIREYINNKGKTVYVYGYYTRTQSYKCSDSSATRKGAKCYHYIDGSYESTCPTNYYYNESEKVCAKYVDATLKKSYECPTGYSKSGTGSNTICKKTINAEKHYKEVPKCSSGYELNESTSGGYYCTRVVDARKQAGGYEIICPTGYEKSGVGSNTKCFQKTTTEGYYYCKNTKAILEGEECVINAKTEFVGYKCPSGYDLNGEQCIKVLPGDKVSAIKTNEPDLIPTYKWSDKKSESGWIWTGETKKI